jgi:protein TonB
MNTRKFALCLPFIVAGLVFGQAVSKKVTVAEAMAAATSKVNPDYPILAKQLKIEGTVELEALVSETGAVEQVKIVSGNPVLTKPAAEALKRWKFSPFSDGGKPCKAMAPVSFTFKM